MKQFYKNYSKLSSSKKIEKTNKLTNLSLRESETVVTSILEKIISLSMSEIYKSMIEKYISSFCLLEIRKKIDTIISIQFINHDSDDLMQRKILKNKSQKIILNESSENNNNMLLFIRGEKNNLKFSKSQIIPKYELISDSNEHKSNLYKNKRKNKFIVVKNKNRNLMLEEEENSIKNFWDSVLQPKNSKIDRGASTKINIDNKLFKGKILEYIQEDIKEENQEKIDIKQMELNSIKENKIKSFKMKNLKEEKPKKEKNNELILVDLPSFDIELGKIFPNEDNESIKLLRKEYENELALKKEKEEREKKLKKQRNIIVNEEEINGKKMNSDKVSNISKIKPIKIENLITEFKSIKSHLKEIGKITEANVEAQNQKGNNSNNLKIEINENPIYQFDEPKTERNRKKYNHQTNNNSIYNKKNKNEKMKESEMIEKNGAKYASGSNYDLIKLECGVNLVENRKKKSGGKNYFEKYGRFSYELYQDKLYNTTSENFLKNEYKEILNNPFKENKNKNINDTNEKKKNNKIKKQLISDKVLIREKSDYDAKYENTDKHLNTKTRNLEIVMNNLDLMKEFQLNIDIENKNMKNTKYNFFKTKINKSSKKNKNNLIEINNFNKEVMKNNLWGEPNNLNKKEDIFQKQAIHHNLKYNIRFPIIKYQRQRLPPLSLNKNHQYNISKTKRNISFEMMKIKNLSKDNIYINDNKSFYI